VTQVLKELARSISKALDSAPEKLAKRGARIVQIARDLERGDAALKKLKEHGPEATHTILYADQ
jgi:hypothetical protein